MSISGYIKHDLLASICSGKMSAGSLTLEDLSRRYQVSPTPVRAAVKELVREGYLRKGKNGRLAVSKSQPVAFDVPPRPKPPKDYYQIIADDLVVLSLQGEAVGVREETTAQKYGVSRSMIRQIFNRLAGFGLLEHLPRKGWRVRPFRQADLDDYLDIRLTMELKALKLAWPRLVDADLQAILDGNRLPKTDDDFPTCDDSLHAYLVKQAANHYIADFFQRHGMYYSILFDWVSLDREAMIQAVRHHRKILKALLRRDRVAAEEALANHIRANHPLLSQVIQKRRDLSSGLERSGLVETLGSEATPS